jgi:hypothetical protein
MTKNRNGDRKCVSIRGETHVKLKSKAEADGVSMSKAVEGEVNDWLNKNAPRKPLVLVTDNLRVNKLVARGQQ